MSLTAATSAQWVKHPTAGIPRLPVHMGITVTIDDPKAYVRPWTNTIPLAFQADTELLDSYCDNQMLILKTWSYPKPSPEQPSPR